MSDVIVAPMPPSVRAIAPRLRPLPPPVFPDCGPEGPTPEDIALALALFALLDPESQAWMRAGGSPLFD